MSGPVLVLAQNLSQAVEHVRSERPDLDPDTDVLWLGNGDPLHWIQRVRADFEALDVEHALTWMLQPNLDTIRQEVRRIEVQRQAVALENELLDAIWAEHCRHQAFIRYRWPEYPAAVKPNLPCRGRRRKARVRR
jgi:hypothetical protein